MKRWGFCGHTGLSKQNWSNRPRRGYDEEVWALIGDEVCRDIIDSSTRFSRFVREGIESFEDRGNKSAARQRKKKRSC
jgi:hypothetical protein